MPQASPKASCEKPKALRCVRTAVPKASRSGFFVLFGLGEGIPDRLKKVNKTPRDKTSRDKFSRDILTIVFAIYLCEGVGLSPVSTL